MTVASIGITQISKIDDVENKLFIVNGRDLLMLSKYDDSNKTAHSVVEDFQRAREDSGEKCFYEYTPSVDFLAPEAKMHYAVDPDKDLVLKSNPFLPGIKIANGTYDDDGKFFGRPGKESPNCVLVDKYFRSICENETARRQVWFAPGQMTFDVIDGTGRPIKTKRVIQGVEIEGYQQLTVYSYSQRGVMKCLEKQGFALINKPSDTRSQANQLSFLIH